MSALAATHSTAAPASRRPLVLLLLLFALPFTLAALLHLAGWRPAGSANHGELLQPPQALPAAGLTLADGRPLPTSALAGRWQLVLAGTRASRQFTASGERRERRTARARSER